MTTDGTRVRRVKRERERDGRSFGRLLSSVTGISFMHHWRRPRTSQVERGRDGRGRADSEGA